MSKNHPVVNYKFCQCWLGNRKQWQCGSPAKFVYNFGETFYVCGVHKNKLERLFKHIAELLMDNRRNRAGTPETTKYAYKISQHKEKGEMNERFERI